jgi:aspartate beta-hydroxylase
MISKTLSEEAGLDRFHQFLQPLGDATAVPLLLTYPGLRAQPWHDAATFPIVQALEAAYPQIAAEVAGIDATAFHAESEDIQRAGSWKIFLLYERGRKNSANCERCPVTTGILDAHDTVKTAAGLMYFSRMSPGAHVTPHCGPTNVRLRCHLGIDIPDGDCAIRVGTETRRWQNGRCLVFDDSFEHEAWNHTDRPRTVLIVDIWHPDLTRGEITRLNGLNQYVMAIASNLDGYWQSNERARAAAQTSVD